MKALRWFLGAIAGNAAGGLLCLLVSWLASNGWEGYVVFPSIFAVPMLIGFVAAWIWKPLNLTPGGAALSSLLCTFLTLLFPMLLMHEGAVCLIIAAPLLLFFIFAGAIIGNFWFRRDRTKLNVTLLPLLFLLAGLEPLTRVDTSAVVTDAMLIHAPPEKVWPHVTSFPEIKTQPNFWLFRLGLPMPMATTAEGDFVGAKRSCIFSSGAVFKETVAEIDPCKKLTFDIIESPRDPELIGHLTPLRGQFELRDNHDGTTTLVGRTWYILHVRPLWYFDAWTQYIFRAEHLRVMENVREMSEQGT